MQGVDGQNGLDVLGDTPVDVVITDINMPVMDGYDVIRRSCAEIQRMRQRQFSC